VIIRKKSPSQEKTEVAWMRLPFTKYKKGVLTRKFQKKHAKKEKRTARPDDTSFTH